MPSEIWFSRHQGHCFLMSNNEVVVGTRRLEKNKCDSSLCSGCVLGKFDRKLFRSKGIRYYKPCKRIHIDIKGPMEVSAIGISSTS